VRAITPALDPAPALRLLIGAVPNDRLRELMLELLLHGAPAGAPASAQAAMLAAATSVPDDPAPAKRRPGWPKGKARGKRKAKAANGTADVEDYSVVRRRRYAEKRAAERAAKAGVNGSPTPVNHNAARNGAAANSEGVSAETFWNHARKLSPKEPWRAVVREFDISNGAAREALRNTALPSGVAAAAVARFLTLPAKDAAAN
jgi:hypothetical protein